MMLKYLFIFLLLLLRFCFSVVIDGPANVRMSPNGTIILSLDDSSSVRIEYCEKNWCNVCLNVLVERKNISLDDTIIYREYPFIYDSLFIKENSILYNNHEVRIGKTITGFRTRRIQLESDEYYRVFITGYTHKTNIREGYSISGELEKILIKNNFELIEINLLPHIQKYDYELSSYYLGFKFYTLIASNGDMCPGPEIILFFYESRLFSILHGYYFKCAKIVMEKIVGKYMMSYLAPIDTSLISIFESKYFPIIEEME